MRKLKFRKALVVASLFLCAARSGSAQTIVDEWGAVKTPKPPELKPVTVDPKTTALLVLDLHKQTCNPERRPRCTASLPKVQKLLQQARASGAQVVHSLAGGAKVADIWKEVAPLSGEPVVQSVPDKFFRTDLEEILKSKGIKTVVVVGTAAHGAVLYTASGAAFRGLQVIVPVDGLSAEDLYIEQYTVYHLTRAPRVGGQVTLTRTDMIKF